MFYISLMGAFGLFMVTTGLLQWWPRTGLRLRQAGIHRGAPKKPVFRRLHRSIGVAMSAFIYFSLATGLTLSLIFFLDSLTAIPVPPAAAPSEIGPFIDQAIVRARAEFPTHEIRDVRFAGAGRSNIFFRAVESNPRAFHLVGINLPDLDIAVKLDADRNTSSWVTIYPLHTGESFGTVGRVLVLLNGLSISLLATSGPIMWLQRHRRRSVRTTRDFSSSNLILDRARPQNPAGKRHCRLANEPRTSRPSWNPLHPALHCGWPLLNSRRVSCSMCRYQVRLRRSRGARPC